MASRWFRLPESGDGSFTNPLTPDLYGHAVDGLSGTKSHPDGAPYWVVRVFADNSTLDSLASESGVVELSSVPTDALNQMFGQNRDAAEWKIAFKVQN